MGLLAEDFTYAPANTNVENLLQVRPPQKRDVRCPANSGLLSIHFFKSTPRRNAYGPPIFFVQSLGSTIGELFNYTAGISFA